MPTHAIQRRRFLHTAALTTAGLALARPGHAQNESPSKLYDISIAQWSLNRQFFSFLGRRRGSDAQKMDPQDFAIIAKKEFGIEAVEYVNQFYTDAVKTPGYLEELKKKSDGEGVRNVLIMCDGEGNLGDPDKKRRLTSVRDHIKWLEWAQALGCHSIRVNARSDGKLSYREQMELAADGLRRLSEIGDTYDLNVIVENHGGLSSHGRWLVDVMEMVDHPRCGTLPDFGNFRIKDGESYDSYRGIKKLMPWAKGVSVKDTVWDDKGNQAPLDFVRMLRVVLDAGFDGYCGIEFGGFANLNASRESLEQARERLS
jgi:L-ribulose-5-phosphate 3-epimerase